MIVKEKKKVILTLCKVFPMAHPRAKQPTEFAESLRAGKKIHTVRGNDKNLWQGRYQDIASGKKYLSIRQWTGRPYNSEQEELARLEAVGLQKIVITYSADDVEPKVLIDDVPVPIDELAKNDGLSTEDFTNWFCSENTFEGVVIHFTDFRYGQGTKGTNQG